MAKALVDISIVVLPVGPRLVLVAAYCQYRRR